GSQHLTALLDLLKTQFPTRRGLVLEIESPTADGLDVETRQIRARRLAFYERLGARRMPVGKQYLMPNFVAGKPAIPAELLWIDFAPGSIDNDVLKRMLPEVYAQIYHLDPLDPLVRQVLCQF